MASPIYTERSGLQFLRLSIVYLQLFYSGSQYKNLQLGDFDLVMCKSDQALLEKIKILQIFSELSIDSAKLII